MSRPCERAKPSPVGPAAQQIRALRPLLEEAGGDGVDVVISSQCYRGHTDLSVYPGGRALVAAGAIAARDMTFEAVITKTMWALGQPERSLRDWFEQDLAGEVSLG